MPDVNVISRTATLPRPLWEVLQQHQHPGLSALLRRGVEAWLREQGIAVPDVPPPLPMHEAARLKRQAGPQKKRRSPRKDT